MLNRIVEITDHKCYRQFKWADLPELSKLNLFYGWNGSGKTTLSNLLALLEKKQAVSLGKVTFQIDKMQVQGDKLADPGVPLTRVKVFNQKFVENNVLSRVSNLEHIVFFGEKTVKHEEDRATAAAELEALAKSWKDLSPRKTRASTDLDNYNKQQASTIKELLRTAGKDKYTNYDKAFFESRCKSFGPEKSITLPEADRAGLVATIRADVRDPIPVQKFSNPISTALVASVATLLGESPTSVAIETLRSDGRLAGWVRQGLHIHREVHAKRCLFCENELGEARLARLEQHFDDSYAKLQERHTQISNKIDSALQWMSSIDSLQGSAVYPQLAERMKATVATFEERKTSAIEALKVIQEALEEKGKNIFLKMQPPPEHSVLLSRAEALIEIANLQQDLASEHNQITDNFQEQVAAAKDRLEASLITEAIEGYKLRKEEVRRLTHDLQENEGRTQTVKAKLQALDAALTQTMAPAEDLNRDLALYLGHEELKLSHHGNGYTITRGVSEARDLSEGEKTAFALLYFLKTLEDHRSRLEETIVVIDDPVSSLDASALFTAFGFIKERTAKAKQIIVLTHDFSFFHLVKGWFQHEDKGQNSQFFSLRSQIGENGKYNTITKMDRLLKDFSSEYQYLFSLVKKGAESDSANLAEFYGLPNLARKLIEHFIVFKYPGGKGKELLIERMRKLNMDAKTLAILNRFLNIHSHGDDVPPIEHDLNLLSETPKVMRAVIEAMRVEDKEHVERLEALTS